MGLIGDGFVMSARVSLVPTGIIASVSTSAVASPIPPHARAPRCAAITLEGESAAQRASALASTARAKDLRPREARGQSRAGRGGLVAGRLLKLRRDVWAGGRFPRGGPRLWR